MGNFLFEHYIMMFIVSTANVPDIVGKVIEKNQLDATITIY
jgi:hypothetical protein